MSARSTGRGDTPRPVDRDASLRVLPILPEVCGGGGDIVDDGKENDDGGDHGEGLRIFTIEPWETLDGCGI